MKLSRLETYGHVQLKVFTDLRKVVLLLLHIVYMLLSNYEKSISVFRVLLLTPYICVKRGDSDLDST